METTATASQLREGLQKKFHEVTGDGGEIRAAYRPSSLFFWEGRGRVDMRVEAVEEGRMILEVRIRPVLFRFDPDQLLFLLILGLSIFGLSRGTLNGASLMAAGFLLLTSLLIAPYLLLLALLGQTLLVVRSYSYHSAVALAIGWLLFLLLLHGIMRYNRSALERRWRSSLVS